MDEEVITAFQSWCAQHHFYGAWDFWRRQGQDNLALSQGFAFAPATDEQLQETEDILGFLLPSLLRLLYKELANGGFGPGAGLCGAVGGSGTPGTRTVSGYQTMGDETIVKYHAHDLVPLLNLAKLEDRWVTDAKGHRTLYHEAGLWFRELIPLFDLGCQVIVCSNAVGSVFFRSPSEFNELMVLTDINQTLDVWLLEQLSKVENVSMLSL
jgi:hypothetical protein